ncbi:MAG: 16S rRNA (guanine(527)-N(7))-methyltransferase RsmG, partial [Elusimicrobiota bacterium]|nr:16S rRNA (guanine(527)-N(7))-methyltransferase RsmG [Elusimicrobiota bacterium]
DCMFVVKAIKERGAATDARLKIIDLGSGAGFPAIIVSIIFDQSECVLVESITKKCNFLNEVKKELNLKCEIINERAEIVDHEKKYRQQFDFALSRAVCKFSQNLEIAIAPLRVGGHFLVCKTKRSIDEKEGGLQSVGQALKTLGAKLDKISSYNLPTSDLEYCILDFCKIFPTPNVYPRNASLMQKKPL